MAGLVPGLAVLVAAAQVGEREDPPCAATRRIRDSTSGVMADLEAAVAGHEQARGAVALEAFFAGDEHGNAGAVLGGVEDLLDSYCAESNGTLGAAKTSDLPVAVS